MATQKETKVISLEEKRNILRDVNKYVRDSHFLVETTWIASNDSDYNSHWRKWKSVWKITDYFAYSV